MKEQQIIEAARKLFYQFGFKKVSMDEIAKEANVREMWLTHYSPSLTHPEMYMDEVRKIFPASKAGKDRMSVEMKFD